MLTVLHPTILASVQEFPGGFMTARRKETGSLLLIVKAHKEYLLAARMKGGFSFYLAVLPYPVVHLLPANMTDLRLWTMNIFTAVGRSYVAILGRLTQFLLTHAFPKARIVGEQIDWG